MAESLDAHDRVGTAGSVCDRLARRRRRQRGKKAHEIQAELDRLTEEHKARIQANKDEVAKEKERFYGWRLQKQQEEQKISDSVSYFVVENPITTGGVAAASRGAQAPTKPSAPKP